MSSFEAPTSPRTRSRVTVSRIKRPPLVHRSSDPEFSEAELDDALEMGKTADWAHLDGPIYVDKDVAIYRPTQVDSSLPIYYATGRLGVSSATFFDALLDARYRKTWDLHVQELHVIARDEISDVMYSAVRLPWPLATREYVYRRRVKYYAAAQAFVVLYHAAHHATVPSHATRVRVETCRLRLCIRNVPSAGEVAGCTYHLEYEDDTSFRIPQYGVTLLLRTRVPAFLHDVRTACAGYAAYVHTLDETQQRHVPSRVVMQQRDAPAHSKREPDLVFPLPHSWSAECLSSSSGSDASRARSTSSTSTKSDTRGDTHRVRDDCTIEGRKQPRRLHFETDVDSNRVSVAYCDQDRDNAAWRTPLEPGMVLTSVNGKAVMELSADAVLRELRKTTARRRRLGFVHPARVSASRSDRRCKAPQNVVTCVVSSEEKDVVEALRPLNPETAVGAVLTHNFVASPAPFATGNVRLASVNRSPARVESISLDRISYSPFSNALPQVGKGRVLVPADYLVYKINNVDVRNAPFAEIVERLRRRGEPRVVTFKAGMAMGRGSKRQALKNMSKLSKRFPGVFRKHRRASDVSTTASVSSTSSYDWTSEREARDEEWNPTEDAGLIDYAAVTVTANNVDWVWQQVLVLKATERLFSAGLLLDRLEAFVSAMSPTATKTRIKRHMDHERALLDHIKERRHQGVNALREFNSEDEDDAWQFGQRMWGVTTSWKPDEDGSVWIKLEGLVDGVDIFNTIAVIREVDLYRIWTPFCSQSLLLEEFGRAELAAYLAISSPLLQRDTIIRAFGINAVYEHGCLLLLGQSVDEASVQSSTTVPTVQGWNAGRMEIKGFRALIEPLSRMQARTCIVVNLNPKCALPRSMLNFGIKKIAGVLLYLIRKEAEKMEQEEKRAGASAAKNEHLRRIREDPSGFYQWIRPIIDKYFQDRSKERVRSPRSWTVDDEMTKNREVDPVDSNDATSGRNELEERRPCPRPDDKAVTKPARPQWSEYLYDAIFWPYFVLLLLAKVSVGQPLLSLYALKFLFTCTCTWLAVPGACPRASPPRHRACSDWTCRRRCQCLMVAALLDVVTSGALHFWSCCLQCHVNAWRDGLQARATCFARSPLDVRDSMHFLTLVLCFIYASVIIGMQLAGKI
ncbi:hypothetical protein PsorP6_000596 [Peronosclerospora sorghi]|uniref:Uncharacterized protein n=1 Tax=Peronosclerospora sorghi TaxID=230839 RepID=A0ACC0WYS7_9STRA|nr:hypothetical protein PsorP6_000596 [Peronosclerospora sorghi]